MRTSLRQLVALPRITVLIVVGLALANPAAAQLGGLKKKLNSAAGATAAADGASNPSSAAAPATTAAAPATRAGAAGPGTIVLTDDVVDRYIAGIKAGEAEREAAARENTPYGRYIQGVAAYDSAKVKCSAAQAAWPQRAAADEKMRTRYEAMANKMVAAMDKHDMKMYEIYADSALAIMDASCIVKQPKQPDDWYDQQRKVDERAEKKTIEKSGFTAAEYGAVSERITAILRDAPGPDISASEKSAVDKRKKDLVPEEKPAPRAEKPAPAAQQAPTGPSMSPGQQAMTDCMSKNADKHKKKIEELGERSKAAQEAGNTPGAIAIADSINQLMMAGCQGK